jgi:hypothetical protein
MAMTDNLFVHLNYPLDNAVLLESAKRAREFANPYTDARYPGMQMNNWYIGHYTDKHIEKIMSDFGIDGRPRFYWTEPNSVIPKHVDNGTQCSLNFILSDDPAPITFFGKDYFYTQVLLNTTLPHSVTNGATERILLKISIFDETYEELSARIGYKAD